MTNTKLSDVERIKSQSQHLRGTLRESLTNPVSGAIADDDTQLSKFHGIYQQDDRDVRSERKRQKLEPAYRFMIRARLPGGVCHPEQWLAVDRIADQYAGGAIRLTTRQAFQLHGVVKRHLKQSIQDINATLLDTIAACGDVNRNVMCSPNPETTRAHQQVYEWAGRLSDHLTPRTKAYHEIWLDGERITPDASTQTIEPIYGDTYLPRKFKSAIVIPPQNDVDIYTQDLGFIAIVENDVLQGFNVTVGGGMGSSHGEPATYPRLADTLGFCGLDKVLAVAEAVVTTQRDHGDRTNRKHARLKYTIDYKGLDWFRSEVERRADCGFEDARPVVFNGTGDRFGWQQNDDGTSHFTLFIDSGRVVDHPDRRIKSGLRAFAELGVGELRLTPNQNIMLASIPSAHHRIVDALLKQFNLLAPVTPLQAHAMACVALPTCGLAMAEAERYLPELTTRVHALLEKHGIDDSPIVLRVTGCPNGCARPFVAEIALVGKAPGRYNLYLGAAFNGSRLNKLYAENIDETAILDTLDSLFGKYAEKRTPGERFGDFCIRSGVIQATLAGKDFHSNVLNEAIAR